MIERRLKPVKKSTGTFYITSIHKFSRVNGWLDTLTMEFLKKLQYKTSLVLVCGSVPVSSATEAVESSTVVKSKGGKYSEPSMFCFSVDQEVD